MNDLMVRMGTAVVAGAAMVFAAPVVAVGAACVAIVASVEYVVQSAHYDVRKAKNIDIPAKQEDALSAGWYGPGAEHPGPSAACHQYTASGGKNVKYVLPDGHREAIYDSKGQLVLDSRDIGTYNFSPSGTLSGDIGHGCFDILPWFFWGNDDDDPGFLINEINKFFNNL